MPDADLSGSKAGEWMKVTNDCDGIDKQILACIAAVGGLKEKTEGKTKTLGELKAKHAKKEQLHKDCVSERNLR